MHQKTFSSHSGLYPLDLVAPPKMSPSITKCLLAEGTSGGLLLVGNYCFTPLTQSSLFSIWSISLECSELLGKKKQIPPKSNLQCMILLD